MSHGTAADELARRIDHDAVVGLAAELIETPGHQELSTHERAVAELLATRLTGPAAGRIAVRCPSRRSRTVGSTSPRSSGAAGRDPP